jgi:cobalt/nickel transport system ATP-binding protein
MLVFGIKGDNMIDLNNVSFSYKEAYALKDININITKGEAVALVGSNGSGKSTFLKLINGIVFSQKGTYRFEDKEINEKVLQDSKFSKLFHKKIGFVFQSAEAQLFCSTVYEEIAFGPRQMCLKEVEVEVRVNDCLKLLNIEELKNRTPYNLSGGEKKRVAIASVLSLNPEVLVLDEPMNGLDPKTKRFLRELLLKLNAAGKTIICSTHDFEYVQDVFKRAIVFSKDHSIVRDDEYEKVINDEEFLMDNNIK